MNIRTRLAAAATAGLALMGTATTAQAASIGGITTGASGYYSACPHTVQISPWSNERVYGSYTVWARASVNEPGRGWVTSPWFKVDGITSMNFYGVYGHPYGAQIQYAKAWGGYWHYSSWERVGIQDDLDNGFCS